MKVITFFELANHLGNVLVTVSDRKFGQGPVSNLYTSFTADVVSATDYAPFGMQMVGRSFDAAGATAYRDGFNGQEKTPEVSSNSFTAEYWQYDARIGRRWNVDPKPIAGLSSYSTFSGNPIYYTDPLGDTTVTGAGGTQSIDIDDKQNSLHFYSSGTNYKIAGTNTSVPIKPGQLRSFSNVLGTFNATWITDANGNAVFAGYKNDKVQDLATSVDELNEFLSSWKYKLWSFGDRMYEDYQQDPVGHNLKKVLLCSQFQQ